MRLFVVGWDMFICDTVGDLKMPGCDCIVYVLLVKIYFYHTRLRVPLRVIVANKGKRMRWRNQVSPDAGFCYPP
ncbi:hypothetical protein, partial [Enterobacter intestinihominis]